MKRRIAGQVEWTYLEADPVPYIPRKIAKGSRVGLVNAFTPSLFKSADITIGSQNITKEVDNYLGYKCLLDIIFSGKTMQEMNEYETLLYTKDENTDLNVTDPFSGLNRGLMWCSSFRQ